MLLRRVACLVNNLPLDTPVQNCGKIITCRLPGWETFHDQRWWSWYTNNYEHLLNAWGYDPYGDIQAISADVKSKQLSMEQANWTWKPAWIVQENGYVPQGGNVSCWSPSESYCTPGKLCVSPATIYAQRGQWPQPKGECSSLVWDPTTSPMLALNSTPIQGYFVFEFVDEKWKSDASWQGFEANHGIAHIDNAGTENWSLVFKATGKGTTLLDYYQHIFTKLLS